MSISCHCKYEYMQSVSKKDDDDDESMDIERDQHVLKHLLCMVLLHPAGRVFTSDWFITSFIWLSLREFLLVILLTENSD